MSAERLELQDEEFLVHVKAQVMVRDDSKGGWVPRGAGGMSIVGLCQLPATASGSGRDVIGTGTQLEFLIYGRRIADRSVVLKCTVHKDLQYTRANPTFHHWRTEGKRFGLTFQSSTEARLFEKAIRKAVEGIRDGHVDRTPASLKGEIEDILAKHCSLSFDRKDSISRPESTASTTVSTPSVQSPTSPSAPPFPVCPDLNGSPPIVSQPSASTSPLIVPRALSTILLRAPRRPKTVDEHRKLTNGSSAAASNASGGVKISSTSSGTATGVVDSGEDSGRDPPWYRTFPPFTAPTHHSSATGWLSWPAIGLPLPKDACTNASPTSKISANTIRLNCASTAGSSKGLSLLEQPMALAAAIRSSSPSYGRTSSPVGCLGAYTLSGTAPTTGGAGHTVVNGQEEYVHFATSTGTGPGPMGVVGKSSPILTSYMAAGGFEYSYPQLESVVASPASSSSSSSSSSQNSSSGVASASAVDQHRRHRHRHRNQLLQQHPVIAVETCAMQPPPAPTFASSQTRSASTLSFPAMPPLPPPPAPSRVVVCRPAIAVHDRPSQQLLMRTARCVHCQEMFDVADNRPGSCREAPPHSVELIYRAVDWLSCGTCARFVLRQCDRLAEEPSADASSAWLDGDEDKVHPCAWSCTCGSPTTAVGTDQSASGANTPGTCCRRWAALGVLSVVVPCVWCYWPLTACSNGAIRCHGDGGGGRHRAI